MEVLQFLFGIFGDAAVLFLLLATGITFQRILRRKSAGQFSRVPYAMTLFNCLLSAWYGLPFVSPHNILVSTFNFTGAAIETVYVLIFIVYAAKNARKKMLILLGLLVTVVVLVSLFVLHGQGMKLVCRFVFTICMYAAPLAIIRHVIKQKSVQFMPIFLGLFVCLCGASWLVYCVLGRDLFFTVPNGFGCALESIKIKETIENLHFVFWIFGNAAVTFNFLAPMKTFRRILRSKSTNWVSHTICIVAIHPRFGLLLGADSRSTMVDVSQINPEWLELTYMQSDVSKIVVISGKYFMVCSGQSQVVAHSIKFAKERMPRNSNLENLVQLLIQGYRSAQAAYGNDIEANVIVGSVYRTRTGEFRDKLVRINNGEATRNLTCAVVGSGAGKLAEWENKEVCSWATESAWEDFNIFQAKQFLVQGLSRAVNLDILCGGPLEIISVRPKPTDSGHEMFEEGCLMMAEDFCEMYGLESLGECERCWESKSYLLHVRVPIFEGGDKIPIENNYVLPTKFIL